jgi:hypothetical protein
VPAAAQIAEQPTKRAAVQDQVIVPTANGQATDEESTHSIEETLVSRLASTGLTDIEMFPLSFVARAKNADGRPVSLRALPR